MKTEHTIKARNKKLFRDKIKELDPGTVADTPYLLRGKCCNVCCSNHSKLQRPYALTLLFRR